MDNWIFTSTLLRSRENYLLDYPTLVKWSEAPGPEVFYKYIKDSVYADLFTESNMADYEAVLESHLMGIYAEIEKLVPDPALVRIRRFDYDLGNIKMALKSRLQGLSMDWEALSEYGSISPEDLYSNIEEKVYFKFPAKIAAALYRAEEEFSRTGSAQVAEFILDNAAVSYKLEELSRSGALGRVRDFFRRSIDLENIKNLLRAKRLGMERPVYNYVALEGGTISADALRDMFVDSLAGVVEQVMKTPYGRQLEDGMKRVVENTGFSLFEKQQDEALLSCLDPLRFVSQGPEVVEEYIQLKKMEIKNLKILFIGKLNDIEPGSLKTRLREVKA